MQVALQRVGGVGAETAKTKCWEVLTKTTIIHQGEPLVNFVVSVSVSASAVYERIDIKPLRWPSLPPHLRFIGRANPAQFLQNFEGLIDIVI